MSDEGGWFHCGRCGHLFRGVVGQACPKCGGHPVVEEKELAFLQAASQFRSGEAPAAAAATNRHSAGKRHHRKTRGGLRLFVIGWLIFLGLLVGLVALVRRGEGEAGENQASFTERAEDQRDLSEAFRKCSERVKEYLRDTTPEGRAKLVYDRAGTLRKMVRTGDAGLRADEDEGWKWKRFAPLSIDGQKAYEGVVDFDDGKRAEFVFLPDEDGELGIDWANLVRYSEHPWPLFLSGDTPSTGEFRLLARRRAGPSGQQGDATSIVLFAPDPWHPEEIGGRSPEIGVHPGSREARMLRQAFEDRDEGRGPFGSRLQKEDPLGMIRVRVKLRWSPPAEEGEDPRVEIEELRACHWLSVDDPGVDVGE